MLSYILTKRYLLDVISLQDRYTANKHKSLNTYDNVRYV